MKTDINPVMAKLPFSKFEKWFKKNIKDGELSAKDWYVKLGGVLPKKKED